MAKAKKGDAPTDEDSVDRDVPRTRVALKRGHPTDFRRTVVVQGAKEEVKKLLVFQPDTLYELGPEELAGVKPDIDKGMLEVVTGESRYQLGIADAQTDPMAVLEEQVAKQAERIVELEATRDSLQKKVAELEGQVAKPAEQLAELEEQIAKK